MSIVKQVLAGASGQGGEYTIDNSLRFRSSASAYLSRTFSTPTNQNRWTLSCWVKRGSSFAANSTIMGQNYTSSSEGFVRFDTLDRLQFQQYSSAGSVLVNNLVTSQVFRDPSAWYHIVIVFDSAGSGNDRQQIWVNGERVTSFAAETYSSNSSVLNQARATFLGQRLSSGYIDGYMTEINFIDGQALTADDFGEFDETTGVWKPKAYSGSYGTNGFYLDGSGVTDGSGNGNNWTNNNLNLSTSSATTYDLMTDVPTLTDENTANYATLNAVDGYPGRLFAVDGNLKWNDTSGGSWGRSTIAVRTGKWYWEVDDFSTTNWMIGVSDGDQSITNYYAYYAGAPTALVYLINGQKYVAGSASSFIGAIATSDVVGFAVDADAGSLAVYKNGTLQGTITGLSYGSYSPMVAPPAAGSCVFNFGQRPFAYTPPTGFKSLNTYNLPDSDIIVGAEHFNTVLYSGNSSTQSITGVGFQPDLVWAKDRTNVVHHTWTDAVRGAPLDLFSSSTSQESNDTNGLTSFAADGFNLGSSTNHNVTGHNYVAWNWKANGSGVSNSVGSIPSTVSANTTAGFSIVTYTGTGATSSGVTIGHGLGVTPEMIITKIRDTPVVAGGDYWSTWHKDLGGNYGIWLNLTNGRNSSMWGGYSNISSTVFSPPDLNYGNSTSKRYVNYLFASVEGFSSIGSYTGNGSSTDGPFIYTGFRPAWILLKSINRTGHWTVFDSARDTHNLVDHQLDPNYATAEGTSSVKGGDFLSNGWKCRSAETEVNQSGYLYLYMAFAENPFKYALAR